MSLLKVPFCCRSLFVMLVALVLVVFQAHAAEDEVFIYSEDYPPFNSYTNKIPQGISVELLELMFQEMGAPFGIEVVQFGPWSRGYQRALTQKNSMLFSTYRTPAREKLFKWVGPIVSSQNGVIIRSDSEQDYSDYSRMKGLTIGVVKNDIGEILLKELNIPDLNIVYLFDPEKAARMLENGRLDAWAYDVNVATDIQRRLGMLPEDYVVALPLGEISSLYFAFNIETDDNIVERYQQALNKAKQATNSDEENLFEQILLRFNYRQIDCEDSLDGC